MSEQIRIAGPGDERGEALMAIAWRRAGMRKGGKAIGVLVTWAIAEASLGRPLGQEDDGAEVQLSAAVEEFGEWQGRHVRTAWRDLEAFREAFPEETSPARLAAELRAAKVLARDAKQGDAVITASMAAVAA